MRLLAKRVLVILLALVMVSAALVVAGTRLSRAAPGSPSGLAVVTGGSRTEALATPDPNLSGFMDRASPVPAYWNKMTSSVREAARSASGTIEVAIYTTEVAHLGALLRNGGVDTKIGSAPSAAVGPRVVTVEVPAALLEKIAALDGVVAVAPAVTPELPEQADPDMPAQPGPVTGPVPTIIEAGKGHQVPQAWALGYTGDGINVAVMDSGVDFGNPDLQGTFARVTDPFSPYYDWPIAFDPNSMYQYLLAGGTFPASPRSWYVDTSFATDADPGTGDLNNAFNGHVYNVAGIPSASGLYHLGLHPDYTLNYYWWGEPPAVLLTDSVAPGVYDTVYVDLNDDYVFGNDKPTDVNSPEVWADFYNAGTDTLDFSAWDAGDGIADASGGMVYFIADGSNPIPYSDVLADRYGLDLTIPGAGDVVAFMIGDVLAPGGDHGTLCTSAIVAQNVTGRVLGFAPDARIIAVGDIYAGGFFFDIYQFVAEGYDGVDGTGDEAHVASASFGTSSVFNDGWDYEARWVELMSLSYLGTAFTVATGNGGHGFGTITAPSSSNGVISVGASTSYNAGLASAGFEDAAHSTFGDVQPWSNRGPSALGMGKPDVVTVGAWATGDGALNAFFFAPPWTVWGGTSLAAPATAGIEALIAQAWLSNGLGVPWLNVYGKMFLVDSADNIHYDGEVMGHGLANAYRAVRAASLQDGLVVYDVDTLMLPGLDWAAGDYRGTKYPSFAHIMSPGQTYSTDLDLVNANFTDSKDVTITDWQLNLTASQTFYVNTTNAMESAGDTQRPDYLMDLTPYVPLGTDLVKVTASVPFSQFDPDGDYVRESSWRLVLYDWADYNGNGVYWNDLNGNGVVNAGEMDNSAGTEIMRFTYGYPTGTNLEAFVHDPLDRIHDGLLLGLQHRYSSAEVPFSNLTLTVDYYDVVDAPWLSADVSSATIPAMGASFSVLTVSLPADQPFGTLSGMVTVTDDQGQETQFPVTVNVAATGADFAFGSDPSSVAFLDNNRVFGGFDWTWHDEAGDWRSFFTDIPDSTPISSGDSLLVHTWWENVPTDLDTIVMGPTMDEFSGYYGPSVWGPYTLDTVGQSEHTLVHDGVWTFQTATGGAEEWVSAPLQTGLHEIALHNVLYAGLSPSEVFGGEVGRFGLAPSPWTVVTQNLTGTSAFAANSTLDLPGLDVVAYGISPPVSLPNTPINASAEWATTFSAADIGILYVQIDESTPQGMDLDLYLYCDTGSGYALVAMSAGPTASERIRLTRPADGNYAVVVVPFSIPAGEGTFDYLQVVAAGSQLVPSDVPTTPIPAGTPATFNVSWNLPVGTRPGWYFGVLFVGPTDAPAVEVDGMFYLYDDYAPDILSATPADGSFVNTKAPAVVVRYEDPQVTSGIDQVRFAIDGMDLSFAGHWNDTAFTWSFPFDLTEGSHDAIVVVLDNSGFWSSYEWTFTVDTAAPNLNVTAPTATLTNVATVAVTGSTDPDALVEVNGVPVAVDPGTGSFSTAVDLAEGSNLIATTAVDAAGNTAVDLRTIVLDTIPPALAVTAPSDGDLVNVDVVRVTGTAEVGVSLVVNGLSVIVDSGGHWAVDLAFADGAHAITITATDAAGNTAQDVRNVTVDTVAPALEVTSPSNGVTNANVVTVEGVAEAGVGLTVNGVVVTVQADGSFTTDLTLAEGSNSIEVEAVDAAGNTATVTRTVVLDTAAPAVAIAVPASGARLNVAVVHVTGTAETGSQVTVNGVLVVLSGTGTWSADLAFADGPQTVTVVATDAAGNSASASRSFIVDTTPPTIDLSAPVATLTNSGSVVVAGSVSDPAATVTVDDQTVAVSGTGAFSTTLTLAQGSHTIFVNATDAAGNRATATWTIEVDTLAPVVVVGAPAEGLQTDTPTVVVSGTVDDAAALVLVNGIQVHPSDANAWSVTVALSEGANTITVSAVDPAGNQAAVVTRHVTYTSPIPNLQNGIDDNTQAINAANTNLLFVVVGLIAAIGAVGAVVYWRLSKRIEGAKPPKSLPPPEDILDEKGP